MLKFKDYFEKNVIIGLNLIIFYAILIIDCRER